jgi:hypothetical protein
VFRKVKNREDNMQFYYSKVGLPLGQSEWQ